MKKSILVLLCSVTLVSIIPNIGLAFDKKQSKHHNVISDPFSDDPFFQSSANLTQQIRNMQKTMDKFMESQVAQMQAHFDRQPFGSDSNVQIIENNNEIIYKIKLPKGTNSKVDATVKNNNLVLSLDVNQKVTRESSNAKSTSYSQSYYSQSFQLPKDYDAKSMDTKVKDSNLIVKFKKIIKT